MIVCYCVCAGLAGLYWVVSAAANRRKEAESVGAIGDLSGDNHVPNDLTDFQQAAFRYLT